MSWINAEMHELITVRHSTGHSASGKVYSAAVVLPAYAEPGFQQVTDQSGAIVTASLFLMCKADCGINPSDEIVWLAQRYEVISSEPVRDQGVTDHVEIYAKSAGAV